MKRINLFFLSLLACLLVGTNAWGAIVEGATYSLFNANGSHRLFYKSDHDGSKFGGSTTKNAFTAANFVFEHVSDEAANIYYIYSIDAKAYVKYSSSAVDATIVTDAKANASKWAVIYDGDKISLATYETRNETSTSSRLVWGCASDGGGNWSAIRNNTNNTSKWTAVKIGYAPSEVSGRKLYMKNTNGYLQLWQSTYMWHSSSLNDNTEWVIEDVGDGFVSFHNTNSSNTAYMGYANGAAAGQDKISTTFANKKFRVMQSDDTNYPYALRVDENQNANMYLGEPSSGAKIGLVADRAANTVKLNFLFNTPCVGDLLYIESGRGSSYYFKNTGSNTIHLNSKEANDPNFMWYFADAGDSHVNLYNLADGTKWGWTDTQAGNTKIKNLDNCLGYDFTLVSSKNTNYPTALQTVNNNSLYLSNHGGTGQDMGLYGTLNDDGTRFKTTTIASEYEIYTVSITGVTGDDLANAYIYSTSANTVNANYHFKNGQKMAWTAAPQSGDFHVEAIGGHKSEVTINGKTITVTYTEAANDYAVVVNPSWLTAGGVNYGGTNYGNGESFEFTGGTPVAGTDFTVNEVKGYTKECSVANNTVTVTYTFAPDGKVLTFYHSVSERGNVQRAVAAVDNNTTHGDNVVLATKLEDLNSIAANQKWIVTKVDGQDYYTLRSLSNGRYMSLIKATESVWKSTTDITDGENATNYVYLRNLNSDATYNLSYSTTETYASAHEAGNQRIVCWGTAAGASRWLITATDAPTAEYKVSVASPTGKTGGVKTKDNITPLGNTTLYNTGEAFFFAADQGITAENVGTYFEAVDIDGYNKSISYNAETRTISATYTKAARFFTLRYIYKYNDVQIATEDFANQAENTAYPAPTSSAIVNDYYEFTTPTGTFEVDPSIAEGSVIEKTLTATAKADKTFPFTLSSGDTYQWYYIKMRDNKYAYYDKDVTDNKKTPVADAISKEDKFRWAFVGTPYGFKIINKAAGTSTFLKNDGSTEKYNIFDAEGSDYVAMYHENSFTGDTKKTDGTGERSIYIKVKGTTNHYINRNGGLYYWFNGSALGEVGSAMAFEIYDAKAELTALYNEIDGYTYGTTTGTYIKPDTYQTTMDAALAVINTDNPTIAECEAQMTSLTNMKNAMQVNMPLAGHFYTIAATGKSSYYMRSIASTVSGKTTRLACSTDEVTQHNNVFYYNDNKLQGYTEGKYVSKLDNNYNAGPGETGAAMSFEHKAGTTSFYLKIENTRYLFTNNNVGYISSAEGKTGGDNMTWELVDVTPNIYKVSFTPTGLTDASVIITGSEDRAATETTPWIYSADAISAANLTCGTVTGYNFETPVVAETPNRTITVTYYQLLSEGFYWLTSDNTNYLTYDGSSYTTVASADRVAGSIFYINGETVKAQGKDVSSSFEYKKYPVGDNDYRMYKDGTPYVASKATGLKIDVNGLNGSTRKYATLCAPFPVQIPAAFDAYNATVNTETGVITLSHITGLEASEKVIEAGTPVLIHSKDYSQSALGAAPYTTAGITYLDAPTNNDPSTAFKGSFVKTSFAELTGNNYVLGASNGVIGFYKMKENANLRANSAYVQIPSTPSQDGNAKGFSISFEDDPTTIYELVDGQLVEKDAPIYNLGGQKISKLQKGINIVNGKKVLF